MFADYHVHTEFRDDPEYPMEQAVTDAHAYVLEGNNEAKKGNLI